ncbi:MAG TPA: hypothetical protein VHV28_13105 [Solirubrobacteraceae bacterium]|nr:hypothetical protein [Solirubrobacteraceae bacterium]
MRGRRFVRPTLTFNQKGAEVRALADLEHKPWAAEDGEVWLAAFNVDAGLDGAREIALSVAPDIAVELRRKGRKLARPGDTLAAEAGARTSRVKDEGPVEVPPKTDDDSEGESLATSAPAPAAASRRRPDPAIELERLAARLASATAALEQERERRSALAKTLEEERTATRQLRTELGQARSELEVAATARAEADAVEAELDDARRQLREAERRHEADTAELSRRHEEATQALARDHGQVAQAHAALQDELRQKTETLAVTHEALATERAETGRLHNRLSQIQDDRQRGITSTGARTTRTGAATDISAAGAAEARPAEPEPRVTRRATSRAAARQREPDPTETQHFDVLGLQDDLKIETAPPRPSRRAARRAAHESPEPPPWTPPMADRLRPLNPSLRHRNWWFGRLLALLVLCGVIAAVYLVLHTTVLH